MSKKVKVLYFVDRMLRGGIQTFVIENMKHIDKEKIQIDYLLLDDGNKYELEDTLKEMGANVYKLYGVWIKKPTDYFNYFKKINGFFKEHHDYKVVHLHSSSKNFYVLKAAKKYGIPVRIAHSHSIGFQSKSKIQNIIGNIFKPLLKRYATNYFACSKNAGEWLFGERQIKNSNVKIIHNAVDLERFKFDEQKRKAIRKQLNIDSELVIGHVGRFVKLKNHDFLIDMFSVIHKKNKNSILMLVGNGECEEEIRNKVEKLELSPYVRFIGFKDNVNEYILAMDVFVFPSLFEGLGLVLIEAQATGIKCFTSKNVVPLEAKVSNVLEYIPLESGVENWANIILNSPIERVDTYKDIKKAGYDIRDTAKELEEFYINS